MGRDTELAILFADVVGSTQLYEALGDNAARETVQKCIDAMTESTEHFGGTVVKTMGDEVMATAEVRAGLIDAAGRPARIPTEIRQKLRLLGSG